MWNRVGHLLLGLSILAFVQAIATPSHHHQHHHQRHQQHSHQPPVQDTNGNELEAGTPYYIVSAVRGGAGGGVSIGTREQSSTTTQTHTSHTPIVKQSSYDRNLGTPVIFSPASSSSSSSSSDQQSELGYYFSTGETEEEILESTDLNIRFSGMNNRVWQVEEGNEQSQGGWWWWSSSSSESSNSRCVTLNGRPGNPGESTVRNWFRIERMTKNSPVYRIAYCPSVCESSCDVECGTVGITKENGERLLSVSEHSEFPFVFVRAGHSHDNNNNYYMDE